MKKIYISITNKILEDLLVDILNNLNYLPIILRKKKCNIPEKEKILFLDYKILLNNVNIVKQFDIVVCLLTYKLSIKKIIDNVNIKNTKIIEYYKDLSINNIKNLFLEVFNLIK